MPVHKYGKGPGISEGKAEVCSKEEGEIYKIGGSCPEGTDQEDDTYAWTLGGEEDSDE